MAAPEFLHHCHAPAKLNLCLHITGRRADGYHEAPLLTLGSSTNEVAEMLELFPNGWTAADLVRTLTEA